MFGLPFLPLAVNATIVPPGSPTFKGLLAAPPQPPQSQPGSLGSSSSSSVAWNLAVAIAVPVVAMAAMGLAAGVLLYLRGRRGPGSSSSSEYDESQALPSNSFWLFKVSWVTLHAQLFSLHPFLTFLPCGFRPCPSVLAFLSM